MEGALTKTREDVYSPSLTAHPSLKYHEKGQSFVTHRSRMERFHTSLRVMRVLSQDFRCARVVVALALLLSVNAPLVQYACGATGEALTTSVLAVMVGDANTAAAPCGTISDGVHDRLCTEDQSFPVCHGDACTTDTAEKQSVFHSETSLLRVVPLLVSAVSDTERAQTSRFMSISPLTSGAEWVARESNSVLVRLRTLSFRL